MKTLHKYLFNVVTILALLLVTTSSQGQSEFGHIYGPTTVNQGSTTSYDYTNYYYSNTFEWFVYYGGTIQGTSPYPYTINVLWDTLGSSVVYVDYEDLQGNFFYDQLEVEVLGSAPSTPPNPTIQQTNCGNTVLARAEPPSGVTFYWQSYNTGTSTANSASTITKTSSGTQYLRARNSSGVWSAASSSITYTVSQCTSSTNLSDENYIYTIIPQIATNDVSSLADEQKIEQVNYFDGLGRPMQQVGIRAGGNSKDIITHIGYDDFGRQDKEYLPYAATSNSGAFIPTAESETANYYDQGEYELDFPGMDVTTVNPYSETHFEASPLNRVLEQGAPGAAWAVNKGSDGDHTIKFGYSSNSFDPNNPSSSANDNVRLFTVSLNTSYVPTLVNSGHYQPNQLYKTITKDENWTTTSGKNHTTEEFKDKQGRIVLKRTFTNTDLNNDGDTSDSNEQQVPHDTYYVYDVYGNLTYVIPPKADGTTTTVVGTTKLNELCYQYKYDHRNRLVEKKIPGKGWEYIVYNKLDQPILTQDEVQRNKNTKEWLYTKYDAFGRVISTGIFTNSSTSQAAMQQSVESYYDADSGRKAWEEKTTSSTDNYYTNHSYPTAGIEVLTLNYYDNYTFDTSNQALVLPSGTNISGNLITHNVKGLPTGSKVKVLEQSPVQWITTISQYDKKGRVLYTGSYNEFLKTTDKVKMELDFVGIVKKTETYHKWDTDPAITAIDNFTYDHANRLTKHTQTIGTKIELITHNTYSDTGELITKKVGNTANEPLQAINYNYNVRGWLKGINNESGSKSVITLGTGDLFGFQINYNDATDLTKALYNGNISQTLWKTLSVNPPPTNSVSNKYTYEYDALNRITAAMDNSGNYDVYGIIYDKNGNIKNLKREGKNHATNNTFGLMDNLTYTYGNNNSDNQLVRVDDVSGSSEGFKNGINLGDDYGYDTNGNLTSDANKGIGTSTIPGIKYNHLNLPTEVKFNNSTSQIIKYTYDATGVKLRKEIPGKITDYAGNFIYEGGTLQFFSHPEGYVSYDGAQFNYIYNYVDHLGNIRLSYTDGNQNNTNPVNLQIIQEKNYYPFGLTHQGYNGGTSSLGNDAAKRYGFGGKELQSENISGSILDWYDISARNYDPALGRWMNIDPLAEEFFEWSPYNYTYNNPIFFIDPTGMGPETIYEDIETGKTVEVKDGIDKTIKVNSSDFEKAKSFANEINPSPDENGLINIGVSREVADGYNEFYNSVNSYDGFSLANLYDYAFNEPKLNVVGEVTGSAGALEFISAGAGGFILKSLGNNFARNSSKILNFTSKQLQSKFKHAADFGVKGGWNKAAAGKFSSAINQHINSSSVQAIQGTYRGNPVIHYLNSKSGLNVIANPNGTFVSGWKLNSKQLENVVKHGGL